MKPLIQNLGSLGIIACAVAGIACAPIPTATELGPTPPPGSSASDVSDSGRIVGMLYSPVQAAEFEANGDVASLPIPAGYERCLGDAIADDGTIAGTCMRYTAMGSRTIAFFAESARAELQFIPLDPSIGSIVKDMNDRGVILVTNRPEADNTIGRSWTYDTATNELTELHGPPNTEVSAAAINDPGDVLGIVFTRGPDGSITREIALWARDTRALTTVAAPGEVTIEGMNNRGGFIGAIASTSSAVYWSSITAPPELLPVPPPRPGGWGAGTSVRGVNDEGWIVGTASYALPWSDVPYSYGVAWAPDRRIIDLGDYTDANAINASNVIVGARGGRAVRFDL